jgi:uncharacterized BrkB/YihY/UPF0761 family membrane protein
MVENGVLWGILLLFLIIGCGVLLGAKAAASVRQFREEHHESFVGRKES